MQIYFKTFDDAYKAAKAGDIVGFIQFSANFTESLPLFNDDHKSNNIDKGFIEVFLDKSDLQITSLIERKLFETYANFSEHLMTDCNKSKKAGGSPLVFKAAFGNFNFDFKTTIVPGFLIA